MTALPHLFMPPAEPLVLSQSSRLATLRPNWNWPASDVMAVQILLPQRASALVALANDLVEDLAKDSDDRPQRTGVGTNQTLMHHEP